MAGENISSKDLAQAAVHVGHAMAALAAVPKNLADADLERLTTAQRNLEELAHSLWRKI